MSADGMLAFPFTSDEEMAVDPVLGYPKAYAKLCGGARTALFPYGRGPPFAFLPYALDPHQEALRSENLDQMFPIVDPEATPSVNTRGYANLLWKQLDHLGNAGFDPTLFRVDPYGNVLYLYADAASPLAWDVDHWFPCSRGGKTVLGNLRLLQWQVCKKKQNELELLVPWWDLQLGISVSQFLCIFASNNSDFRSRAFSFLFIGGRSEELNPLQVVDSHTFPQHFMEIERLAGLAPAAIVSSRSSDTPVLKPLNINSSPRANSTSIAKKFQNRESDGIADAHSLKTRKSRTNIFKENNSPHTDTPDSNPYFEIVMARDSLKWRQETRKKQAEISRLQDQMNEVNQNNETGRLVIQELEAILIKKRHRVEKTRRLAQAQSSYRDLLEKMIRDAKHQNLFYEEKIKLNQHVNIELVSKLEAHRAFCQSPQNETPRQSFKQRHEFEKHIRPISELAIRPCMDDTTYSSDSLDGIEPSFMRGGSNSIMESQIEEQICYAGHSPREDEDSEETTTTDDAEKNVRNSLHFCEYNPSYEEVEYNCIAANNKDRSKGVPQNLFPQSWRGQPEDEDLNYGKLKQFASRGGKCSKITEPFKQTILHKSFGKESKAKEIVLPIDRRESLRKHESYFLTISEPKVNCPTIKKPRKEEEQDDDDEHTKQVGKENIDKWLHILLGDSLEEISSDSAGTDSWDEGNGENSWKINHKDMKFSRLKPMEETFVNNPRLERQKDMDCIQSKTNEVDVRDPYCFSEKSTNVELLTVNSSKGTNRSRMSFDIKRTIEKKAQTPKSDNKWGAKSLPSSPSINWGMRRGLDADTNQNSSLPGTSKFIRSCSKAIKKVSESIRLPAAS